MADNSEVARAKVTFEGDINPLRAANKQAEAETKQTADKINASLGSIGKGGTFDGIANGIKESTAGVRNLFSVVSSGIGMLTRTLGIIGMVTGAVTLLAVGAKKVYDYFNDTANEAERIETNLKNAAAAYERYVERVRVASKNLPSPTPNTSILNPADINKDNARAAELLKDIELRKQTRRDFQDQQRELDEIELRRQQRAAAQARAEEIERQQAEQERAAKALKSAQERAKAELDAQKALHEAERQRMEEKRQENERYFRRMEEIEEKRTKRAEEQARIQIDAAKESAAILRETAEKFNAHMSSSISAMRNQFDQMASNVGRLMEIAEAQRLNGKH